MRERLYILDGHGYVFRAHFALMGGGRAERKEIRLANREGMPTGALYVFARMLLRFAADRQPARMAVVFDAGRKSFRTELYPEYKAHRPPTPEDLAVQLPYFGRFVEALNWPVLSVAGVEADDVIATLVKQARAADLDVVILSADKDLMQLVGEGVEMFDSLSGKTYHREEVVAKFGIGPERIADYLALVGDTSDNVPGVEGIGEKTALKLLAEFATLDAMVAANPVVARAKVKQPFADDTQRARLDVSRQLVALRSDVPLPRPVDDLRVGPPHAATLQSLCGELDFQALADTFLGTLTGAAAVPENARPAPLPTDEVAFVAPAAASGQLTLALDGQVAAVAHVDPVGVQVQVVAEAEALANLCDLLAGQAQLVMAVDIDMQREEAMQAQAVMVSVPDAVYYVPLPLPKSEAAARFVGLLASPTTGKVVWYAKRAQKALRHVGLGLEGIIDDPMLAAFVDDPTRPATWDDVRKRLALPELRAHLTTPDTPALAGQRALALAAPLAQLSAVAEALRVRLRLPAPPRAGLALYEQLELPISSLLATVEDVGVTVDVPYLKALAAEVGGQLLQLEQTIHGLAGEAFHVGSPKQLGRVLFETLKLTSSRMKKNKTGYSTDHEVLEAMLEEHPIIAPVLEHRELAKLKNTYLDALPPLVVARTGRLHTVFHQAIAATGRLSSQEPNLQNIPIRSELGRKIRRAFIAAPGKLLIAADYSQIELRILAHLSGDPVLTKAFRERVDVHTQTACEVFGLPPEAITAHHRRIAKAVNYGLIYGQSDFGLARALSIPRAEAAEYSTRYFQTFPAIRAYLASVVAEARRVGGTITETGRYRPLPELASKTVVARRAAERIAQNTPMQSLGADILKRAMLASVQALAAARLEATMLLTVHDELVFEAEAAVAEAAGEVIRQAMEAAYQLSVPLAVDVGIAPNWTEA